MKKLIAMILTGVLSVSGIGTAGVFAEEFIPFEESISYEDAAPYDVVGDDYSEVGLEDVSVEDYVEDYDGEVYSEEAIEEIADETMVSEEYIEETDDLVFEEISIDSDDTENSIDNSSESYEESDVDLIGFADEEVNSQASGVESSEVQSEESLVGNQSSYVNLNLGDNIVTFSQGEWEKTYTLVFDTNANADRLRYELKASDADTGIYFTHSHGSEGHTGSCRFVDTPGSTHQVTVRRTSEAQTSVTLSVTRMPDIDHFEAVSEPELIAGPRILGYLSRPEIRIKVYYKDGSTEEALLNEFAINNSGSNLFADAACTQVIADEDLQNFTGQYAYEKFSINESSDWCVVVKYKLIPYNPDDFPVIKADNQKHEIQSGKKAGFRLQIEKEGYYQFVGYHTDFAIEGTSWGGYFVDLQLGLMHSYMKAGNYFVFIGVREDDQGVIPGKGSFCIHMEPTVQSARFEVDQNNTLYWDNWQDNVSKAITYTDPETNDTKTCTAKIHEIPHDGDYYFESRLEIESVQGHDDQRKLILSPQYQDMQDLPYERAMRAEATVTIQDNPANPTNPTNPTDPTVISGDLLQPGDNIVTFSQDEWKKTYTLVFDTNANADRLRYELKASDPDTEIYFTHSNGSEMHLGNCRFVDVPGSVHQVTVRRTSEAQTSVTLSVTRMPDIDHIEAVGEPELIAGPRILGYLSRPEIGIKVYYKDGSTEEALLNDFAINNSGSNLFADAACTQVINEDELQNYTGTYAYEIFSINESSDWRFVVKYKLIPYDPNDFPVIKDDNEKHEIQSGKQSGFRLQIEKEGYYQFVGFNTDFAIEGTSWGGYDPGIQLGLMHSYLYPGSYFVFVGVREDLNGDIPGKGSFCIHKQPTVQSARFEVDENKRLSWDNWEDNVSKVITYTDPETNDTKTCTAGLYEIVNDGGYYFESRVMTEPVEGHDDQLRLTLSPEFAELNYPYESAMRAEDIITLRNDYSSISIGDAEVNTGENTGKLLSQVLSSVLDENDHSCVVSSGTKDKIKQLLKDDPSCSFSANLEIEKEHDAQASALIQNALPLGSVIKDMLDIKIVLRGNGNVLGDIEEINQDLELAATVSDYNPGKKYSVMALHNGSIIKLDITNIVMNGSSAELWFKSHLFSTFAVVENDEYIITVTQPSTVGSFTVKVNDGEETDQSTTAKAGDNITLSAAMNSGYYFSSFTVKDLENNLIPVSDGSASNVKKFTMPEKSVSVTAAFSESAAYVDPTPVHTHSYVDTVTKEATCGQDGVITHTCSCGNSYTSTIPATGNHSYGTMGIITTPATCTAEGAMTYTCSVCGNTKTETVKATGHEWNTSYTVITAPTETAAGSKAIFCSVCGAMQPGSEAAIPATEKPSGIKTEEEKVDAAATVIQSETSTKAEVNTAIENLITDLDSKNNEEIIKGGSQSIDTTKDGEETSSSLDLSALEALTDKIDAALSGAEYKDVKIGSTESAEAVIGEEKIEASLSGGTAIAAAAIRDAEESALDSTASVRTVVKLENAALKDNVLSFDLKADVVDDKNNVIRTVGTAEYHELPSPVTVTITLPASMSELVNLVVKHDGVIVPYQAVYKNGKIAALKIALGSLSPFTITGESPADAAAKVAEELCAAAKGMTESSTAGELRAAIKAIDDIDDQTMRYLDNSQRTALEEARAHAAAILTAKTAAAEEKAKAVIDAGKDLTTKEKVDAAEAACVALSDADKAFLTETQLADVTSAEEKIHHAKAVQMAKDVIEAGKDLSTPEKVREAKAALDLLGSTGYARFLDETQDAELIAEMNAASQAITAAYEAQGVADLVQAVIDAAGKDLEDKANLEAAAKAGLAAQDLTEELLAKLDMTKRAEYEAAKAKITAYCAVDQAGEKLKLEGETLTEENIKAAEKDVTDAADAIAAAKALGVDTPKLEEALTKLKADLEGVKEAYKKKLATEAENAVAAAEKAAKEDLTKADKLDAARKAAEAAQTAVDKAKAGGADVGALTTRLSAAKDAIRKAEGGSEVPSQVQAYLKAAARVPASDKIKEKQRKLITAASKLYKKLTKEQKARADVKAANKKVKASLKALNKPVIKFNKKVQKALNKKGTKTRWIKVKAGKTLKLKAKSSTGARITYKSSKKKVATVSKKGVIKAKKKGKAVITVKCNKKTVKVRIRVK